jgi:hypothetical protein
LLLLFDYINITAVAAAPRRAKAADIIAVVAPPN